MKTPRIRQRVRYVNASDGTRLAWAEAGDGPLVVKAANWLTHLEYEWESPVWKHWIQFFSAHFRFVRYDERGCGMSEWHGGDSVDRSVGRRSRAVIDAARPDGPVTLLGISQGAATCVRYATRHPERVARMILYGGYARGALRRNTPETEAQHHAMIDLARVAWGKANPTFRQVFTSRFIPGGTPRAAAVVQRSLPEDDDGRSLLTAAHGARRSSTSSAARSTCGRPTLVLHARDDEVIPIAEGRLLAGGIPGAEFVELDSRNHILLEHEPAWQRFREAVLAFVQPRASSRSDSVFAALSVREREVLALIAEGLSNTDIAERLNISEKTVRNHASNLFDKLGVWSRAQAIVFARDHGFSG